jgi:hypothetical protein
LSPGLRLPQTDWAVKGKNNQSTGEKICQVLPSCAFLRRDKSSRIER